MNKARCSWCKRTIQHKRFFGWTHICEGVYVGERAINRGLR